ISQPAKCGPSTFQSLRFVSDVRTNAPFRVPTNTRIPLINYFSYSCSCSCSNQETSNRRSRGMKTDFKNEMKPPVRVQTVSPIALVLLALPSHDYAAAHSLPKIRVNDGRRAPLHLRRD